MKKDEKIFNELYNDFIIERINNSLIKNSSKINKYSSLCDKLLKTLNSEQKEIFDEILNSLNSISADELITVYKIAIKDSYFLIKN